MAFNVTAAATFLTTTFPSRVQHGRTSRRLRDSPFRGRGYAFRGDRGTRSAPLTLGGNVGLRDITHSGLQRCSYLDGMTCCRTAMRHHLPRIRYLLGLSPSPRTLATAFLLPRTAFTCVALRFAYSTIRAGDVRRFRTTYLPPTTPAAASHLPPPPALHLPGCLLPPP